MAGSTTSTAPSQSSLQTSTIVRQLINNYISTTPQRLKLIDSYLVFILLTGILQFVYALLVGSFPYNSFLAGFLSAVASFCFAVNLRMQINPKNTWTKLSPERAFADFVFCHVILHLFVINFLG